MNDENVVHVVLGLQDKSGEYSQHTGVVIASILNNTKKKVQIHILHDQTLTDKNRQNLKTICDCFRQSIKFHFVNLPIKRVDIKVIEYLTMGILFRLDIVNQLQDVEKALYLDSDIVMTLDIAEMFDIDISKYAVAAIKDRGAEINPKLYTKHMPVDIKNYFNSGVILFNLKKIREKYDLLNMCLAILEKYPNDPFPDQSALNVIFKGDCLFLNQKYNCFPTETSHLDEKCCWHFAGAYKPWAVRRFQIDKIYWQYLKLTPWGDTTDKMFECYAKTVVPLDIALLTHPSGKKKMFFKNACLRIFRELIEVKNKFFS